MENKLDAQVLLGRSRVRQRILALLFDRPERRTHLRGISRAVGTSAGTTARELERLVDAGLVTRSTEGRQVYFQAAADSPLFEAVRTIVRRTVAAPDVLRRHLAGLSGIDRAFIYGSYARRTETAASDVDLMIVGSPDVDELTDRASAAESELGRPINYTILTEGELADRRKHRDRFIASVDKGPTLPVIEPSHA
jgi:predicted nucleotidyltransferase/predicted transcriptional regulator with HTH domain